MHFPKHQTTPLIHHQSAASLIQANSIWPPDLKDFLVQDSGAKDSNALRVDDGLVAPGEGSGQLLLTVHNHGDALLLHADSNTMPSEQQGRKVGGQKYKQKVVTNT